MDGQQKIKFISVFEGIRFTEIHVISQEFDSYFPFLCCACCFDFATLSFRFELSLEFDIFYLTNFMFWWYM